MDGIDVFGAARLKLRRNCKSGKLEVLDFPLTTHLQTFPAPAVKVQSAVDLQGHDRPPEIG
jgi:hypothetical protein